MTYVDLDDFCQENSGLDLLWRTRDQLPDFKATLFAIPGRCPRHFLRHIQRQDWIDLVPHGWTHDSNYEAAKWTKRAALEVMARCEDMGMARGFKAPGWQISAGCYEALVERGWWVADQSYNNERRPPALRAYLLDSPDKIHGHIGHFGGPNKNELSLILVEILKHRRFGFVREALAPTYDIIIPHYGVGELTAMCLRCLETIRQCSHDYRLIFVDNASPEFNLVTTELARHPHLLIRNGSNLGFVRAVNAGLRRSSAAYVVLLNNDTEVVPGWLEALREPLQGKAGISGPRTTTKQSWQGTCAESGSPLVLSASSMLAFFCVMIRRDVLDRTGLLDEEYGVGLGDDDDYCRRVHQAGYDLVLVRDLVIPHHHRSTFTALYGPEEIREMQDRAISRFQGG